MCSFEYMKKLNATLVTYECALTGLGLVKITVFAKQLDE